MFEALSAIMMAYAFVSVKRNPIAILAQHNGLATLHALAQYTIFPKTIVRMLLTIRDRARQYRWREVEQELTRNIGEELGTETEGIQHYNMLMQALNEECRMDLRDVKSSPATERFIKRMFELLKNENIFTSLGAVYALEATAKPELVVVVKLITNLRKRQGVENPGAFGTTAHRFFELHISVWEPGHEEGLRRTIEPLLNLDDARGNFQHGFIAVLGAMATWWQELADEASLL